MATLVHPSSAESTTSQLDLFSVPLSQTSLEDGSFTEYHPVSVLTSTGPIEFTISAENSNYIDLANSFFYVRASVTTSNGDDLAKTAEIAPECNFLHTLWSQVDVYLNGLLVTQSNNNNPYRAYIENLLSFGQEAKNSQLSALLWHRNTSRHFDSCATANKGYTQCKALAAESKEIYMMGKLHIDLTFQNRYLLNRVEVRLRLIRSKDLFCLHGNANQAQNKVSLKEVTLFVRKVNQTRPYNLLMSKPCNTPLQNICSDVWKSRVLLCRQGIEASPKKTCSCVSYHSIGSWCGGQRRIQRCHNRSSFSFQAQQHQFHDDLPGRGSNPFQTAATGFYQQSFYSKLSLFVYANGSILLRHGERYFVRTVQGRLCLVRF